jgi:hypothetical protein
MTFAFVVGEKNRLLSDDGANPQSRDSESGIAPWQGHFQGTISSE